MALLDLVTLPVRLAVAAAETTLAVGELVDPEGPVRRRDGYADRAMLVVGRGGLIDRVTRALTDPRGPMSLVDTVTALLDPERPVGRALARGGTLDRILTEGGAVDRLLEEGGTLDQLVALGATLERIQPRLAELIELIPELHQSVDTLNTSVGPLGDLATRLPGGRRRNALEA